MNRILIASLFSLLIASCASVSKYQPASNDGYGYEEFAITDTRYRISFRARGDDRDMANGFALLRAAELTLQKGYDWFDVVDRQSEVSRDDRGATGPAIASPPTVTRSCGLLGCTSRVTPGYGYTGASRLPPREETEVLIEIYLGRGIRPADRDTYDARQVAETIRAERIN